MIQIEKKFNPDAGFLNVDLLPGYIFTPESGAHKFIIHQIVDDVETDFSSDAAVECRFLKADNVTEYITGSIEDGAATVTLRSECYQVPGRFVITILVTDGSVKTCVYAATSSAMAGDSETIHMSDDTDRMVDEQIAAILAAEATADAAIARVNAVIATVPGVIESIPEDYTDLYNDVSDLKSAFGNTIQKQIAFVQTANSTTSHYYKTFNALSGEKCYLIRLTVETAGTYTLKIGTGQSSANMVDTVGTATVQANVPYDFIGYVPSLSTFTTSRLSVATPHTIDIFEVIDIGDEVERIENEIDAVDAKLTDYDYNDPTALTTGADINSLTQNKAYLLNGTYTNSPIGVGYLIVKTVGTSTLQLLFGFASNEVYKRKKSGSTWTSWLQLSPADMSNLIVYNGTLANNSDLNDIATNSRYILSSNNSYTHAPENPNGGYLITMPTNAGANVRSQYYLDFANGSISYRFKTASGWGDWGVVGGKSPIAIPTKYVAFGDSTILGAVWDYDQTTQWYTAAKKYQIPTRIAHAIGMDDDFSNEAVGGTGFYERSSAGASVTEKIMAYDFTGVEIVTIGAGINDKGNADHPMGTATNPAEGTICYAVKQIIDFFAQNYPAVQVIFMQPLPAGNLDDPWGGTYAAGWSQNDFDEQVGTLCHNEHVGYVNWWESNICKQYASFSGGYSYNPNTERLTGPNYSHMATEIDYAKLGDFIGGKVSALFHGRN